MKPVYTLSVSLILGQLILVFISDLIYAHIFNVALIIAIV